jgi:hypothetical protein
MKFARRVALPKTVSRQPTLDARLAPQSLDDTVRIDNATNRRRPVSHLIAPPTARPRKGASDALSLSKSAADNSICFEGRVKSFRSAMA